MLVQMKKGTKKVRTRRRTTAKVTKKPKRIQEALQQHEAHEPKQHEQNKRRREVVAQELDEAVDDGRFYVYFYFMMFEL